MELNFQQSTLDPDTSDWATDAYLAALEVLAHDGWDDPRMGVYDTLDPRKQR